MDASSTICYATYSKYLLLRGADEQASEEHLLYEICSTTEAAEWFPHISITTLRSRAAKGLCSRNEFLVPHSDCC